jgi:RNA polymerase sigma factor (sigma-70 family)
MGLPEQAGEDALQNAIVLFLQRADAQGQAEFLRASAGKQIGFFVTAMRNNMLKVKLRNRLAPLPEKTYEVEIVPGPAEEVAEQDCFEKALQELSEGQREVMELDIQGYTDKEIAAKLNIAAGTARKRLFDARKNMAKFLERQGIRP